VCNKLLFLAWPFLCNTSSSTRSMLVLRYLRLPKRRSTNQQPVATATTCRRCWASAGKLSVTFQHKQIFNQNLIFFSKLHVYKQPVTLKCVISAFIISALIKDVIANGHDKLNRHMIYLKQRSNFLPKLLKLVDKCSRYSKSNQCHFWYTAWLKRPNF